MVGFSPQCSFILHTVLVRQILKWDLAVLDDAPWYEEAFRQGFHQELERAFQEQLEQIFQSAFQEGFRQGVQQGAQREIVRMLKRRLGEVPRNVTEALQGKTLEQLEVLIEEAVITPSLAEFITHL
jgi:flagellar biosynthesis/type III secretory pathway protein FliH